MTTKRTRRVRPASPEDTWLGSDDLGKENDLANIISLKFVSLSFSLPSLLPNLSYADFQQEMMQIVNEGLITDSMMSDSWSDRISQNNPGRQLNLFRLSFIFSILAERAHEGGENDKAWSLIAKARHFSDLFDAVAETEYRRKSAVGRSEKAINARRTRTENLRFAKNHVISLLRDLRPAGGWKDELSARKAIKHPLDLLCFKDIKSTTGATPKSSLVPTNSQNTLRNWFRDDEDIRAAFIANSFETISKSKQPTLK